MRATGPVVQKRIAGMQTSACDVIGRSRLLKATASLETQGYHDVKRAGQGHSKNLEWLASGPVGEPGGGSKIVGILGVRFPGLTYHDPIAISGRYSRRTWNSDEVCH